MSFLTGALGGAAVSEATKPAPPSQANAGLSSFGSNRQSAILDEALARDKRKKQLVNRNVAQRPNVQKLFADALTRSLLG